MFAGLQQLNIRGQVLARLNGLGISQNQIAVDQAVERGFLSGVFTIPQPLLNPVDGPGYLFIEKRLAVFFVNETDLHLRRKLIVHNGTVHFFKVFGHIRSPFVYRDSKVQVSKPLATCRRLLVTVSDRWWQV